MDPTKKNNSKLTTVTVKKTIDLPLSKVWKAWSEEAYFKKWWGPKNYTCPHFTNDFKVGGKYLACMKEKKGGKEIWSTGKYKEIIPLKKIIITDSFSDNKGKHIPPSEDMSANFPDELIISVVLTDNDGKTDLWLEHVGMPKDMYDDCMKAWHETLEKLEHNIK